MVTLVPARFSVGLSSGAFSVCPCAALSAGRSRRVPENPIELVDLWVTLEERPAGYHLWQNTPYTPHIHTHGIVLTSWDDWSNYWSNYSYYKYIHGLYSIATVILQALSQILQLYRNEDRANNTLQCKLRTKKDLWSPIRVAVDHQWSGESRWEKGL